jgi:hypothetical protein
MKFAAATLAPLPSVREIDISASTNQPFAAKSSDPAETRVTVRGLRHETSAKDPDITSKSIVTAYSSAYTATLYSSTASETKKTAVSVPDNVDFTLSFCSGCRWCPNSRGR